MTQNAVSPWTEYVGDGSATAFAYPWMIAASSDLEVYLNGVLTTAYTITGVGVATGGTVVFYTAPPAGQFVFLRRVTPQTQETDYINNDPFGAETHEAALDKLTRLVQDVYERISRSPAFAVTALNAMRDLRIPDLVGGKLLGASADGTALTWYDSAIQIATVASSSGEVHGQTTVNVPSVGGANFLVATAFIPAGIELAGIGYRVVTAFSTENSLASIDLGGLGITNRWGAHLGRTVNSTNNAGQWIGGRVNINMAQDVMLLPNPPGSRFGSVGMARLTCFWTSWAPQ